MRLPRSPRLVLLAGLTAATLLLGGCVYLHLLELKLQLGNFDRNFAVDTRDGLTLTFNHPMLLDEDVEQFFKWVPDSRERIGTAEKWHFAWVKENASAAGPPAVAFDFDLFFTDHKLVKIVAPERFFAATMPKSLALAALRSLGHAKVNQEKRRANSTIGAAELQTAAADRFLSEDGLLAALGEPGSRSPPKDGTVEWRYRFDPVSKRQKFGDSGTVDVTFTLDRATGKVRLMKGRTVFGSIVFDTTHTGPNDTGTMQAALPQ